jgi:hypothetical protein
MRQLRSSSALARNRSAIVASVVPYATSVNSALTLVHLPALRLFDPPPDRFPDTVAAAVAANEYRPCGDNPSATRAGGWTLNEGPILGRASPGCGASSSSRCSTAGCSSPATPRTSFLRPGAKGFNLAVADVRILGTALAEWYRIGDGSNLERYSHDALRRVWRAEHFSWWMTTMLHRLPGADPFDAKRQLSQLAYVAWSRAAATSLFHQVRLADCVSSQPLSTRTTVRQSCAREALNQWTTEDAHGRPWTDRCGLKTARSPIEAASCPGNRSFKRRGRDLNPRGACTPNGFRDQHEYADLQVFLCSCASLCACQQPSAQGSAVRGFIRAEAVLAA